MSSLSLRRPSRHHSDRDRDYDRSFRRHTYDSHGHERSRRSGGGRRHTNSSSKPYREFEKILLSVSAQAKDMRQVLRSALDQLEESRSRATRAERLALELTQRSREANDERLTVVRQGGTTREELGMYKVQLSNAQAQIARAQETLKVHEERRKDAEAAAARARDTARKLEQERLVRLAREEGRKQGFREGLRAGRRVGFYDGREEGYNEERRRRPVQTADDDLGILEEEADLVGAGEDVYDGSLPYHDPEPAEPGPLTLNNPEILSQNDLTVPGSANSEILNTIQTLPQSPPFERQRHTPRRQNSGGSGSDSTTTLPIAPRDLVAHPRAPRLPTPNIPSPIPEVINTEPSSSRTQSRRGSEFIDENDANVYRTPSQRSQRSYRSQRPRPEGHDVAPAAAPLYARQSIPAPITPESMVGYNDGQQGGFVPGPTPHAAPPPPAVVDERVNAGSTPGPRLAPLRQGSVNVAVQDAGDRSSTDGFERRMSDRRTQVQQNIADHIRGDDAGHERKIATHRVCFRTNHLCESRL